MQNETKETDSNAALGGRVDPIVIFRSGLYDKNGREICLGDTIEFHTPYRNTQTHYGENIPRPCGSYTEPLEPEIKTERYVVKWGKGMFYIKDDAYCDGYPSPLLWDLSEYKTTEDLKEAFGDIPNWIDPDCPGEDDLGYLLEYYPPNSEQELMKYLSGCEVVEI